MMQKSLDNRLPLIYLFKHQKEQRLFKKVVQQGHKPRPACAKPKYCYGGGWGERNVLAHTLRFPSNENTADGFFQQLRNG